jgi:hypothetical protein
VLEILSIPNSIRVLSAEEQLIDGGLDRHLSKKGQKYY